MTRINEKKDEYLASLEMTSLGSVIPVTSKNPGGMKEMVIRRSVNHLALVK